jgi:thioredoxin-like negative regulator of GroEL
MKKTLFLLLILTLVGCSQSENPTEAINADAEQTGSAQPSQDQALTSDLSPEKIATKYFEVQEGDVRLNLLGKSRFALYFFKEDCKTCQEIDAEINERKAELDENTVIAKADFEAEQNLRSDFGIKTESSVAIFDANGNLEEVLVSPNLDQILLSLNGFEE